MSLRMPSACVLVESCARRATAPCTAGSSEPPFSRHGALQAHASLDIAPGACSWGCGAIARCPRWRTPCRVCPGVLPVALPRARMRPLRHRRCNNRLYRIIVRRGTRESSRYSHVAAPLALRRSQPRSGSARAEQEHNPNHIRKHMEIQADTHITACASSHMDRNTYGSIQTYTHRHIRA